ncbi:ComEC/Rec2 family competence protein [Polaribacter aestuariivivens]|nr:ComEC/Rec2 family competence protein [Polaribacter aestuariivivens]
MKKLKNYLPMHFTMFLVFGICLQYYTQFWQFGFKKIFYPILFLLLCFLFKSKIFTTIITAITFFFIGVFSVFIANDVNYDNYYKKYLQESSKVVIVVKKVLKPGFYYDKYEVELIQVNQTKTRGKVLLNIQKDSLFNSLKVDEILHVKAEFKELIPPLNPHQFNYKSYLAKQGVHQQIFIDNYQYFKSKRQHFSLIGLSAKFRDFVQASLRKYQFEKDELAVINALLLGQRQDISKELIADYSRAGAIHILAVSGLHVGVILLILTIIFQPLEKLKNGKYLKITLIVLLLWMFAFIAGLSASVVRAVTMFTFLAVGLTFKKKNIVFFSLVSSLFLLLIVKPMFLFDVGFQLSYLAVFGIIWVQPKLYNLWNPKIIIINKLWQLFTVSIAAQVGILPLSIYYFEQIPSLFLASNLVIIPFLMYILIGGILLITLAILNILPQFFADIYGEVISWMNSFVSWISHQEAFLFKEISISFLTMLVWYVFIFFGVDFLLQKSQKKLLYVLSAILLIQAVTFFEKKQKLSSEAFIVFHKSRFSIIGKRSGKELLLQHDLDSLKFKNDNNIKSYRVSEAISKIKTTNFNNFIKFNKHNILIIDSLGIYKLINLEKPIVVLQYTPKINVERLIKTIKPKQIIADGSNYKSYINRWEIICEKKNIPFHYTGKNGAFILTK